MATELKNIDEIIKAVEQNTCGKVLELAGKKLGDAKVAKLAKALAQNTCLRVLNLSKNGIKAAAKDLGQALKTNRVLHTLELGLNQIGPEDLKLLSEGLSVNQGVRNLIIRGNPIGDKGAEYIADVLKISLILYSLNLRKCGITSVGTTAIAQALQTNKNLGDLDLSMNMIKTGMVALVKSLIANSKLHTLKLHNSHLNLCKEGISLLCNALTTQIRISILDVSWNELFTEYAAVDEGIKLLEALRNNTCLKVIDLRNVTNTVGLMAGHQAPNLEEECLKENNGICIVSDLQSTFYSQAELRKRKESTQDQYKRKFIAIVNQLELLSKNNQDTILKLGKNKYLNKVNALYAEGAEYLSCLEYVSDVKEHAELQMRLEDSMSNCLRNLKYFETDKRLQFVTAITPFIDNIENLHALVNKANGWLLGKGDAQAQYTMGVVYAKGLMDIEEDHQKALAWFMKAAEQSHPESQYLMALYYLRDKNDRKKALEYLKKPTLMRHDKAQETMKAIVAFENPLKVARKNNSADFAEQSRELDKEDKSKTEFEILVAKATGSVGNAGDSEAQFQLALKYENGTGVEKNLKNAFEFYREAALQCHVGAQFNLGRMYENGLGVEKDEENASRWFRRAAVQKHVEAQYRLGTMYEKGRGVVKDEKRASELYAYAAEQNHAGAQYFLAVMYENGRGVAKDEKRAWELYSQAAAQNDADAQYFLARMYEEGRVIAKDEKRASELYAQAAAQNDAGAQYRLGTMYEEGRGVVKDEKRASELYAQAAAQNHAKAQYFLAVMYEEGRGVAKDEKRACELYTQAAAQNDVYAQYFLAVMYEEGRGGVKDEKRASELYAQAAAQNHTGAQFNLGLMYENGCGVVQDKRKALELYKMAASRNSSDAQKKAEKLEKELVQQNQKDAMVNYTLGVRYLNGIGVVADMSKAIEYFEKAALQGDKSAKSQLGKIYEEGKGVKKDVGRAYELYAQATAKNNADASFILGTKYELGIGVEKDEKRACELYAQAAAQNHAGAQYALGCMYSNGWGVIKDEKRACELYAQAAAQGNVEAQLDLGNMYAYGRGVEKDEKRACELYSQAAAQNHAEAQFYLAMRLEEGNGIQKNRERALEMYKKAHAQGYPGAKEKMNILADKLKAELENERQKKLELEVYLRKLEELKQKQKEEERKRQEEEAMREALRRREAEELKRKQEVERLQQQLGQKNQQFNKSNETENKVKSELDLLLERATPRAGFTGDPAAQFKLGQMFEEGKGVAQNDKEAVTWYREAAAQKHPEALFNLGWMCSVGRGATLSEQEACRLYAEAANLGFAKAQYYLAMQLEAGSGILKNRERALEMYQKAYAQGHPHAKEKMDVLADALRAEREKERQRQLEEQRLAQARELYLRKQEELKKKQEAIASYELGMKYRNGVGVAINFGKAIECFEKAVLQGHAGAQYSLGMMYETGQGVAQNESRASELYAQAAEQNHAGAQCNLGLMYEEGRGVSKDQHRAGELYLKAAKQHYPEAQYRLGVVCEEGRGVWKDLLMAKKYYQLSISNGKEQAKADLERVESKLQEENKRLAEEAMREAARRREEEELKKKQEREIKEKQEKNARPYWHFDPKLKPSSRAPNSEFVLIDAGEEDIKKVLEAYYHCPVAGYGVGSVKIIYNYHLSSAFENGIVLAQSKHDNPAFQPTLDKETHPEWRRKIADMVRRMSNYYTDQRYPNVTILPTWHGTNASILASIFKTGLANLAKTDPGFFGKGLYSAYEAEYAYNIYAKQLFEEQGALLLTYVSFYSGFPVIDGDKYNDKPAIRNIFNGGCNYFNYDAHVIPVVSEYPDVPENMSYVPCKIGTKPTYTEFAVFNGQCLPRYLVQLQASLLKEPSMFPENERSSTLLYAYLTSQKSAQLSPADIKKEAEKNAQKVSAKKW